MCDLTKSLKSASTFSAAATTFVSFSLSAATSFSQLTDLSVRLCLLAARHWCVSRKSGPVRGRLRCRCVVFEGRSHVSSGSGCIRNIFPTCL